MRTEFIGREKELAWLRSQFDACATRGPDGQYGGPRMAFIIAESGIGKSRLVQELYLQLTSDPKWDPPEVDYWPDAFKASGQELHVVPDMQSHEAKGPPRFAWLGGRWYPTNERNVQARNSILPELRSSLTVHAEILRSHQSLWQDAAGRIVGAVRQEGVGEVIGQLADNALPFGGLLLKITSGIKEFAADRHAGPKSYEEISQKKALSDVDEVLDCFRLLLDTKSAVPAVLWLDDAQWIDADTCLFLKRLWHEATRRRWPLLIVVTHWEREWRELALAGETESLHQYSGVAGVEEWRLDSPPDATLAECLKSRLPGLTEQQASLMIEKAAGNFLQLLQNIGEMVGEPMNFVDEQLDGPLTEEAVGLLRDFKCNREERVRQRFQKFESDVKKVLGWSSQFGQRFISEVIESFAKERLGRDTAGELVDRCVDPYVVLDCPSPLTREFRDKAFHKVADEYRHLYLLKDADRLSAALSACLVEWITNSVTPDGKLVVTPPFAGEMPQNRLWLLPAEERRDLLGVALEEISLPEAPDWTNVEHKAALWAILLAIANDCGDELWERVGSHYDRLSLIDWAALPLEVCSVSVRSSLVRASWLCLRMRLGVRLAENLVDIVRRLCGDSESDEDYCALRLVLARAARLADVNGDKARALARYQEVLSIDKCLLGRAESAERLDNVRDTLSSMSMLHAIQSRWGKVRELHEEQLQVCHQLAGKQSTPSRLLDVCVCMRDIGAAAEAMNKYDEALASYEEAFAIAKSLCYKKCGMLPQVTRVIDSLVTRSAHISDAVAMERGGCEAGEVTGRFLRAAELLEAISGSEKDMCDYYLDTCAAFWQSRAAAAEVAGDGVSATTASLKSASLRQRIADSAES